MKRIIVIMVCLVVFSVFLVGCTTNATEDAPASSGNANAYPEQPAAKQLPAKSSGTGHAQTCY